MAGADPITTGQVVFILLVVGALFGAWWRVERAITTAKTDMAVAIASAKTDATGQAAAASALAQLTQAQLAEHKLHVAETYITKQGMRETRDEIMSGIKGLGERQEAMNQRMDNIVGSMLEPPAKPRRSRSTG
jgi:hypothetical protein